MLLFAKKKNREVETFLTKVVNNNCSELEARIEGPRLEDRVRLTLVVLVIPVEKNRPVIERMYAAVTKEFSSTGVALVSNERKVYEDVILAFRWESDMKFVRGEVKHLSPMGAGFCQLGVQLSEVLAMSDYPELDSVTF